MSGTDTTPPVQGLTELWSKVQGLGGYPRLGDCGEGEVRTWGLRVRVGLLG